MTSPEDRAAAPAPAVPPPGQDPPAARQNSPLSCRDPEVCRRARKASLIAALVMFVVAATAVAIAAALSGPQ